MSIDMMDFVEKLRASKLIKERDCGNGISSFNFTKKAFYDQEWNELTTKARGLFIDTTLGRIVARGYDKFFNLGEMPTTDLNYLRQHLSFPVRAYKKENGFLGIVYVKDDKGALGFATKSMTTGLYVDLLKKIFFKSVSDVGSVIKTLSAHNATMLVEVISPNYDPHIIQYREEKIVLLDIVQNSIPTVKLPYPDLVACANAFGIEVKTPRALITNTPDLERALVEWTDDDYEKHVGHPVEGFVLEDRDGFMFKVKTAYYLKWKRYRQLVEHMNAGKEVAEEKTDRFLKWYRYMLTSYNEMISSRDIIAIRNLYVRLNGI